MKQSSGTNSLLVVTVEKFQSTPTIMVEIFSTDPLVPGARKRFADSLKTLVEKSILNSSSPGPPPKYVDFNKGVSHVHAYVPILST